MTLEQAIKRIQDKESQIKNLQGEVRETKEKLKELTEYKVGDLVEIEYKGKKEQVYIADVEWYWNKPYYQYKFNKVKKDGTMSGQSAGVYYTPEKITLIKTIK